MFRARRGRVNDRNYNKITIYIKPPPTACIAHEGAGGFIVVVVVAPPVLNDLSHLRDHPASKSLVVMGCVVVVAGSLSNGSLASLSSSCVVHQPYPHIHPVISRS
jgi:hypothetical protein